MEIALCGKSSYCQRPPPVVYLSEAPNTDTRRSSMANHLTPTELARESGLGRKEVLTKCMELGVPIFKGRIDKSLFLASLRQGISPVRRPAA
jgi:hypothetical protein